MTFAVLILTSRNLLVILNIYLTPESLGYRTLYVSQLMSNSSIKEYSHLHNPRRPTGHN
jgi:hypothetical protein